MLPIFALEACLIDGFFFSFSLEDGKDDGKGHMKMSPGSTQVDNLPKHDLDLEEAVLYSTCIF